GAKLEVRSLSADSFNKQSIINTVNTIDAHLLLKRSAFFKLYKTVSESFKLNKLIRLNKSISSLILFLIITSSILLTTDSVSAKTINFGTAGDNLLFNGMMGIGTSDIEAWQTSLGSAAIEFTAGSIYGYRSGNLMLNQNSYYDGTWKYKYADGAAGYFMSSGGHYFRTSPTGSANAAIPWIDAMIITSGGNVGIGTNAPGAKLHVGNFLLNAQSDVSKISVFGDTAAGIVYPLTITNYAAQAAGNEARISFNFGNNSWSSTAFIGGVIENATGAITGLSLGTYNGSLSEKVRISGAGNVGIGTTGPTRKLTVVDNSGTANTGSILFGYSTTANWELARENVSTGRLQIINNQNGTVTEPVSVLLNGYVGIGTTNPGMKLHIIGNDNQIKIDTASEGAAGIFLAQAGALKWELYDYGTAFHLYNYGTASDAWTVLRSNGNVGIGTTAPNDKLSIGNGGAAAPAGSSATGHNYTSTYLGTDNYALVNYGLVNTLVNSTNLWSGTKDGTIWNGTAGAGNVGIGTTNPQVKLHVLSSSNHMIRLEQTENATSGQYAGIQWISGSRNAYIFLGNAASTSWYGGDGAMNLYTDVGNIAFFPATVERMRITAGGSVGIGTTNPAMPLSVVGGSTGTIRMQTANGTAPYLDIYQASVKQWGIVNPASTNRLSIVEDGSTGTERLTVATGGNVGIGTTAPNYKLEVRGTNPTLSVGTDADSQVTKIRTGYQGAGGYGMEMSYSTAAAQSFLDSTYPQTASTMYGDLNIRQNVGGTMTSRIYIQNYPSGNVGIGTTNPTLKLQVNGDISVPAASAFYFRDSDGNWKMGSDIIADSGGMLTSNTTQLLVGSNAGMGFQIMGHNAPTLPIFEVSGLGAVHMVGNVGIGTTAPEAMLHVIGNSSGVSGSYGYVSQIIENSSNYPALLFKHGTVGTLMRQEPSGDFVIVNGATNGTFAERLRVMAGGNVGIGTTAPGAKLDIRGTSVVSGSADVWQMSSTVPGATSWQFGYRDYNNFEIRNVSNGIPVMTMQYAGNIGIGTTAPAGRLTVTTHTGSVADENILELREGANPTYGWYWTLDDLVDGDLKLWRKNPGAAEVINFARGTGDVIFAGSVTATAFIYSSDRNLKQNIATIQSPLEKIMQLRGVTFNWKKDNTPSIGLIAQEVEQVFPELVTGQEGSKAVQYGNLVAPLIEAVKAQQTEIKNNNEEIAKLKAQQAETIKLNNNL
ncbi:MAG: tail fiber domain-containing protein, partial [Candidatus Aquicultor sp.]